MRAVKRTLVALSVGLVVITGVVVALPWSHDLDNQISIKPYEMPIPPPDYSVPVDGREFAKDRTIEAGFPNPIPVDSASEARGKAQFETFCTPCHGERGEGFGSVVKKGFMPPPLLTGSITRGRSDGYIYSYIRHGGVVMPAYGFGLRPNDAWDVVNYVRRLQRENPTP